MLIACYEDNISPYWYETFATAWINDDGSGYTFTMDSVYPNPGVIQDAVIVPVYVTGIPEELWKDIPIENPVNSSKEIIDCSFSDLTSLNFVR
ncbi:MAG: hypothetical protein ACE14V_11945 [bacterium]